MPKKSSSCIRHVVEADVDRHAVFIRIRKHQVGMNRGVDCKQGSESSKPDHQRHARIETGTERDNQSNRHNQQDECPMLRSRAVDLLPADRSQDIWDKCLDDAVSNEPECNESAHAGECPAEF